MIGPRGEVGTSDPVDGIDAAGLRSPLRVLRVINSFDGAGTAKSVLEFLQNSDSGSIEVDVLCAGGTKGDANEAERFAKVFTLQKRFSPRAFAGVLGGFLHGRSYDIVFSHMDYMGAGILWAAARAGVPIRIAGLHSKTPNTALRYENYPLGGVARRAYLRRLATVLNRHATAFFAVSGDVEAQVRRDFPLGARPCDVVYRGFDLERYTHQEAARAQTLRASLGIDNSALVLGHTGAFKKEKNHQVLVDAARLLRQNGSNITLLLCGVGDLRATVLADCERRRIPVVAPGNVGNVEDYYNAMDVFVFPSIKEGLAGSLVEAQACGVPVVASDIAENVEALAPAYRPLMFSPAPDGARDCAASVRQLLGWNAEARNLAAEEASDFVARFGIKNHVRLLEDYWARLAAGS